MATPAQRQALPAKEQALFRTVVRHYEAKQYKKGLKAADQPLKCAPPPPPRAPAPARELRRRPTLATTRKAWGWRGP